MRPDRFLLIVILLIAMGAPAHAALITVDGSFEMNDLATGGYNGTSAWHTDGFVRLPPGGSDGDSYAAAIDPYPADYDWPNYYLFQVVQVSWPSGPPAAGGSTLRIKFDYKMHDSDAGYGYYNLAVAVRGKNGTAPSPGSTNPGDFGQNVFDPIDPPISSDTNWATWEQTLTTADPFDYYTIYVVAANVDLDGMELHVTDAVPVPLPPAVLLLTSGLAGLVGFGRRKRS
jgi:hypothetical protein